MLVGRGEDLVAGPEAQAAQDTHDPLARPGRRPRHVGGVGRQALGVGGALAAAQRLRRVEVGRATALEARALQDLVGRAQRRRGSGPQVPALR